MKYGSHKPDVAENAALSILAAAGLGELGRLLFCGTGGGPMIEDVLLDRFGLLRADDVVVFTDCVLFAGLEPPLRSDDMIQHSIVEGVKLEYGGVSYARMQGSLWF